MISVNSGSAPARSPDMSRALARQIHVGERAQMLRAQRLNVERQRLPVLLDGFFAFALSRESLPEIAERLG